MGGNFLLSLSSSVEIEGEEDVSVRNTLAALKRDMENTLEGPEHEGGKIRILALTASMGAEDWEINASGNLLTIKAGGYLGQVHALYFISEYFLGVSPLWYWNDQTFTKRPSVNIPAGSWRSPCYAVRYRGWFINDEQPIEFWSDDPGNAEHYAMAFEAILRLGGNMVLISNKYQKLASDMGLWLTHHHADPLGITPFTELFPDAVPSYTMNAPLFEEMWEKAVIRQKDYKVIWGLGFRGQGDKPFWMDDPASYTEKERGALIRRVIERQMEIVSRHVSSPVFCTNLYGEMAELYRNGNLKIPAGVIKVWGDNGYGRMVSRRQGNHNPRVDTLPHAGDQGPHGIYFHCSFHDLQASNHITMSPNSSEFLARELANCLKANADNYWIINSGPVKPHVWALDLVAKAWQKGSVDVGPWRESYVKAYYSRTGDSTVKALAGLFGNYAGCTAVFGPREDERAGEQIWHHPIRELLCEWMRGKDKDCVESLIWLTGKVPLGIQARQLEKIALESLPKWEAFCSQCAALRPELEPEPRLLFDTSLYLHARLQEFGARGALAFCQSHRAWVVGNFAAAFQLAERSFECFSESYRTLHETERGKWNGYYRGDCLTDIRLTANCLGALVSYIRVTGEGPGFHSWEEEYLQPAVDRKIMRLGLLRKMRALNDNELKERLPELPF
jgi:hypothetical protein